MTGNQCVTNQERREDDLIPTPPCPRCGAALDSTVTRTVRGVVLSTSVCVKGDPIYSKWLA